MQCWMGKTYNAFFKEDTLTLWYVSMLTVYVFAICCTINSTTTWHAKQKNCVELVFGHYLLLWYYCFKHSRIFKSWNRTCHVNITNAQLIRLKSSRKRLNYADNSYFFRIVYYYCCSVRTGVVLGSKSISIAILKRLICFSIIRSLWVSHPMVRLWTNKLFCIHYQFSVCSIFFFKFPSLLNAITCS